MNRHHRAIGRVVWGAVCTLLVSFPAQSAFSPSLAQQVQLVHQLYQETQRLEQWAQHVRLRLAMFRQQLSQQEQLQAEVQERYQALKSRWPLYIQRYLHEHVRGKWLSPLSLDVTKRRQQARELWASESFARVVTDQLKDLELQLNTLKNDQNRLKPYETYFLQLEEDISLRKRALETQARIRRDVLKTVKLSSPVAVSQGTTGNIEAQETMARTQRALDELIKNLNHTWETAIQDDAKASRVLPVLSLMTDLNSVQAASEAIKFLAAAHEPIAAIDGGRVQSVSQLPNGGMTLRVHMKGDHVWTLTGLGQVFVRPDAQIEVGQVIGQAQDVGGWIEISQEGELQQLPDLRVEDFFVQQP